MERQELIAILLYIIKSKPYSSSFYSSLWIQVLLNTKGLKDANITDSVKAKLLTWYS